MLKQTESASERKALFAAVLSLRSAAECEAFFADLCTPAELDALAGRWTVARLLDKGIPYREISQKTGISTATVTRVARCLTYGNDGGYRRLLDQAGARTTPSCESPQRDGRPLMTAMFWSAAIGVRPISRPIWIATVIASGVSMPLGARPDLLTARAKRHRPSRSLIWMPRSPMETRGFGSTGTTAVCSLLNMSPDPVGILQIRNSADDNTL